MRNGNGFGSVYKLKGNRRKKWLAIVTVGYDKNGKQLRKSLGTYYTKQDGLRALIMYNDNPLQYQTITFEMLKNKWWDKKKEIYKNNVSRTTAYSSIRHLESLDKTDIKNMNLLFLQNFFDNLDVTNQVKKKVKSQLNNILDYGIKLDLIKENKAQYVEIGKVEKKVKRRVFTQEEIKILWDNIDFNDYVKTILILIYTGMRIGELLKLKNENINLKDKVIYIRESKTNSGQRAIPISEKIFDLILSIYDNKNIYFFKKAYNYYRTKFSKTLLDINIESHTIHDTRHTFATLLSNTNANETNIIKLIGHSDYKITQDVYTHKSINELRKTINLID